MHLITMVSSYPASSQKKLFAYSHSRSTVRMDLPPTLPSSRRTLWIWSASPSSPLLAPNLRLIRTPCSDLPFSLNKFFPLWAGADHHDYHHSCTLPSHYSILLSNPLLIASSLFLAFGDCYSTSFRHLDYFFGTDRKYHAARERQRVAKQEKLKAQ